MEMGKLTAKLRDAVPVCFLVEGKEIKRYKNIEIPDEIKKLDYQDFKFDVPLNGAITFKIIFEPGVLPEEFPQTRERRTRMPMPQGTERPAAADAVEEAAAQETQPAETLNGDTMGALAQALDEAQAAGDPVDALVEAVGNGEAITAEIIEDEGTDRVLVLTAETERIEATARPESDVPAKKPAPKGKSKKGAAATEDEGK
jgi:hypothetical protein